MKRRVIYLEGGVEKLTNLKYSSVGEFLDWLAKESVNTDATFYKFEGDE